MMCPCDKLVYGNHRQLQLLSQAAVFNNWVINEKRMAFLSDAINVNLVECSSCSLKVN